MTYISGNCALQAKESTVNESYFFFILSNIKKN